VTAADEPENGSYVCVYPDDEDQVWPIYQRLDRSAEVNDRGDAHWFSKTNMNEPARTWEYLTGLGDIAYVGKFVDRSRIDAHAKGKPWASL
jgi:hypothetical protein